MKSTIRQLLSDYFLAYMRSGIVIVFLIIVAQVTAIVEPMILQKVVDDVIPSRDISLLLFLASGAIVARILASLILRIQQRISTRIGAEIIRRFIVDLYDHIQRLDLAFFADTKMGEFIHRLGQDTYHVYRMIINGIVVTASNATVVLILLVYGFFLSPLLSAVILFIIPIYVITQRYAGRLTRVATESMVQDWSDAASFETEKLGGVRVIKEMLAESHMRDTFDHLNKKAADSFRRLELSTNFGQLLLNLTVYIGPMLVIAIGGILTVKGSMSIGTMLAFFYFSGRLYAPVGEIVGQYLSLQRARVGVTRIYEYFGRESAIKEKKEPISIPNGSLSVEFDNVSFAYDREDVLNSLSFYIGPGETVGIVGTSGAGKSTIANLVCRFWDTQSGAVRIGGVDVRDASIRSVRSRIGIVSQDTILFHDSVLGNLRLARLSATEDEIDTACKIAGIHEFIVSLPEKYNTVLGERGVKVSGGQRQRLSIARAILRDPDILLLDEATSHLDSETEDLVQSALYEIARNRTTILIAHRLSTLSACDRLIVIDGGAVSEVGTHAELIEKRGIYFSFLERQARNE